VSRGLAGHTDLAVGPDDPARLGIGHVLLADMHAIAIELHGEVRPIVQDEGDAALLADRAQRVGGKGGGGDQRQQGKGSADHGCTARISAERPGMSTLTTPSPWAVEAARASGAGRCFIGIGGS